MTVTLPSDMVSVVEAAVANGDYASSSDIVCEALHEWTSKRMDQAQELASLKSDIELGLTDIAEGRVRDFDITRIVEQGRKLLTARSISD